MAETTDANTKLVRRCLSAFNDRDRDTMSELLTEDVVEHGIHEELHGVDEILDFLDAHFDPFPDDSGSTEVVISAGLLLRAAVARLPSSGSGFGTRLGYR